MTPREFELCLVRYGQDKEIEEIKQDRRAFTIIRCVGQFEKGKAPTFQNVFGYNQKTRLKEIFKPSGERVKRAGIGGLEYGSPEEKALRKKIWEGEPTGTSTLDLEINRYNKLLKEKQDG